MKELLSTQPCFDVESWREGFARGYCEGHSDGEHLGEQALRDRLLRCLEVMKSDVRLALLDLGTPEQALHAVELLVVDRKAT